MVTLYPPLQGDQEGGVSSVIAIGLRRSESREGRCPTIPHVPLLYLLSLACLKDCKFSYKTSRPLENPIILYQHGKCTSWASAKIKMGVVKMKNFGSQAHRELLHASIIQVK